MWRALVRFYEGSIILLRGKYSNILKFVCLAPIKYVFKVSLKSFMTCGQGRVSKKNYSHIFLTVFFILITAQSLAPKFALSPIIFSPIPFFPIARSATLTPRSPFPPITCSLIARLLPPTQHPVFCCPICSLVD